MKQFGTTLPVPTSTLEGVILLQTSETYPKCRRVAVCLQYHGDKKNVNRNSRKSRQSRRDHDPRRDALTKEMRPYCSVKLHCVLFGNHRIGSPGGFGRHGKGRNEV